MIFREGQEIRPRRVDGGGFLGIGSLSSPLFATEIWHCYNCGKVRTVQQWKRVRILESSDKKQDPDTGGWTSEQLQSVKGEDLLPDGWNLNPNSDGMGLRLLYCDECFDALKKQEEIK